MVVRSESVGVSCRVQLDVPAQDMGKRPRLQKVDNPQSAFVVSCRIFNQQSARHQEISGKKNPGSAVIKRHVGLVVSRRGNYVDGAAAQVQMGNPVGPVSETEERSEERRVGKECRSRW